MRTRPRLTTIVTTMLLLTMIPACRPNPLEHHADHDHEYDHDHEHPHPHPHDHDHAHHHDHAHDHAHDHSHVSSHALTHTLEMLMKGMNDPTHLDAMLESLMVDDKEETKAMESVKKVMKMRKKGGRRRGDAHMKEETGGGEGGEGEEGGGEGGGRGGGGLEEETQTAEFTLEPHLGPAILPFQVPDGYFVPFLPRNAFQVVNGVSRPPHGHGSFYAHRPPGLVDVINSPAYGFLFSGYRRFQDSTGNDFTGYYDEAYDDAFGADVGVGDDYGGGIEVAGGVDVGGFGDGGDGGDDFGGSEVAAGGVGDGDVGDVGGIEVPSGVDGGDVGDVGGDGLSVSELVGEEEGVSGGDLIRK